MNTVTPNGRLELTRLPWVKNLLRSRWPQLILTTIALAGFLLAILSGLFGTPVGSRNFGIVFVWIAWWALLMLVAVPLAGRGWCSICPIPAPGEWLQRGAALGPGEEQAAGFGLGKRWPKKFRNIWLQNAAFTLVALFSTVVLTQPRLTALVLGAFLVIAVVTSLVYERRAFCRYLCPVGGFIGLYSQLAPLEVRVKDTAVCAAHTEKTCYTGSASGPNAGYGCPWNVFPGGLVKNTYCGTCLECLRTCPHENVALQLRPFGSDLDVSSGRKLDEAYKAFIMLGSAAVYAAVLLGPWGSLKNTAYSIGSLPWLAYALAFLVFLLALLPGLFYLAVWAGRKFSGSQLPVRKSFVAFSYALVPLGLGAWVAFSLAFVFTNLSYLWPALSDPLGWGWDLLGTASLDWTPYLTGFIPSLQVVILLLGLAWACRTAYRIAREGLAGGRAIRQAFPVAAFCLFVTVGLLKLLI